MKSKSGNYIPSRLLQGVVPSALLEAFRFWQAEDDLVLRGDALDGESEWFDYNVDVSINQDSVTVRKRSSETFLGDILRDPGLSKLCAVLTKIEDASHILVWMTGAGKLVSVDLPRLKLRLVPQDEKLCLKHQAGWFLRPEGGESVGAPFWGLPQAIVVEHLSGQVALLTANHEPRRHVVRGQPFGTRVSFDRGSAAWQQVMQRRYYMYSVHGSQSFVTSESLAATLYLILMKLLAREYEEAFSLVESVAVDVDFSSEERWVYSMVQTRTAADLHPDARAVRLEACRGAAVQ